MRLVYAPSAERDLRLIYRYIARESGSAKIPDNYAARLEARCERLASLGGVLGSDRRELGSGFRSVPEGSYTVLFRYVGQKLEILNIVHAARNLRLMFAL